MFLAQSVKKISKRFVDFIQMLSYAFCMIAVCFGKVLLWKNQDLLKEIREISGFALFLTVFVNALLLLPIRAGLSYVLLFLEIVFLLNFLILVLFKKIQIPIKFVE